MSGTSKPNAGAARSTVTPDPEKQADLQRQLDEDKAASSTTSGSTTTSSTASKDTTSAGVVSDDDSVIVPTPGVVVGGIAPHRESLGGERDEDGLAQAVVDDEKREKVEVDMTDPTATIECPNPACELTHSVYGMAGTTFVCSCGEEIPP